MSHAEEITRAFAQHVPVRSLTVQLGDLIDEARNQSDRLTSTLKRLDDVRAQLRDQERVDINVDLGDVGNAAAVARRQLEAGAVQPKFELPRAS